ncbi:MAG: SPOR domain-containing protein [Chromatiales bacterium]
MRSKRTLAVTVLCWFAFAGGPGAAATFEDGRAAYLAKDYARALEILKPLAEAGDPQAQVTLGIMYDYGYGVDKDTAQAINWYKKAAAQGVPAVQHDLGVKYYRGQDVPRDLAEAAKWWRMAAESGLADSQYNLGYMYSRGLGVEQSERDALDWYRKAAAQNHMFAQYSLAVMYAFGKGVETDYARAADLFRKAADQGMAQAQYNLGVLYENGHGVDKDPAAAGKWYRLAADQGLDLAKRKLAAIDAGKPASSPPDEDRAPPPTGRTIHREDWIARQDPKHYTLQVISSGNEEALVALLQRESLSGDVAYFRVNADGRPRYTALYGVFETQAAAGVARARLPASLQKINPWIRKFSAVQDLIRHQP